MSDYKSNTIVKNTLFLYFRMFITMVVALFTVRVVYRTLGVTDYGVYNVIGGVVTSLAFLSDVLANASQRFFAVEIGHKDKDRLQQVFGLIIFAYVITSVVIILIAETLGLWFVQNKMDIPAERMEAAVVVFHFSVASFIVGLITNPFNAMIIAHERMNVYAYVSILQVFLKLGIVYLLVILPYDKLKTYAFLMFLIVVLINSIYIVICRKSFRETKLLFKWDKSIFTSIFSYSSWTLLGSLAFVVNTQGLNILFNLFFGPVANAAYAIGNQIKTTVNSFASNFFVATRPPMIKSYSEGDFEYTGKLFYFSTKIIFALLFILIVPIFVKIEFVLDLWLGKVEPYMASFARLMLIYALVLSVSEPITAIAQAAGKVKIYHGIVDGFTLITLPLAYFAFRLGMNAVYGFVISIVVFLIAHIMRLFILKKFFPLSLKEYGIRVILPFVLTIASFLFSLLLIARVVNSSIVVIVIAFLIALVAVFFFVFDREERSRVMDLLRSKLPILHCSRRIK